MTERWHMVADFELHEQAQQAANILRSLQPVFLHIAYSRDATATGQMPRPYDWEEYTRNYPPKEALV